MSCYVVRMTTGIRLVCCATMCAVFPTHASANQLGPRTAQAAPANVARPPSNARRLGGGVRYLVLKPGVTKGVANPWDRVSYRFSVWTTTGKRVGTNTRLSVHPYRLSHGLERVITRMTQGMKVRAWLPASQTIARGRRPAPGMLVYELEVTSIKRMPAPPPVPKHVARPPRHAKKTARGVYYVALNSGSGKTHPTATSKVEVHYTGWTTNGRIIDSSVIRGKPTTFPLNRVIPGWTDGLQKMVAGQTMVFWIPAGLAYGSSPGRPQGMLVFEVHLFSFK